MSIFGVSNRRFGSRYSFRLFCYSTFVFFWGVVSFRKCDMRPAPVSDSHLRRTPVAAEPAFLYEGKSVANLIFFGGGGCLSKLSIVIIIW